MPTALADFFFIAGLEGHEPAIVQQSSANFRAETAKDAPSTHEPIAEEAALESHASNRKSTATQRTSVIYDPPRPASTDIPLIPPIASGPDLTSDQGTAGGMFDDIMAKFTSERDDFLLTLAPPTVPITPRSNTPVYETLLEEEEDHVPELHQLDGRAPSPLRARSSLRSKFVDLSRRASRASTLRRGNTTGTWPDFRTYSSFETKFKTILYSIQFSHPNTRSSPLATWNTSPETETST